MKIINGRVSTGFGVATKNLIKIKDLIETRMNLPKLVNGTLNITIEDEYIVKENALIKKEEYNKSEYIKLQRCVISGIKCCIMRPNTHEEDGHINEREKVLEIMCSVKLRNHLGLEDGDILKIELEGDDAWWENASNCV